jgi:hypothetical protein
MLMRVSNARRMQSFFAILFGFEASPPFCFLPYLLTFRQHLFSTAPCAASSLRERIGVLAFTVQYFPTKYALVFIHLIYLAFGQCNTGQNRLNK